MSVSLRARKIALYLLFLVPGIALSSWTTRTPAVRDAVNASTAEMGLVILGLAGGSMLGILCAGPAVNRVGARRVITVGSATMVVGIPLIGIGAALGSAPLVAAGLASFGFGQGLCDISVNVEGVDIEQGTRRSIMPTLHGFFSLGTVVGAAVGIGFTALDFPVVWHMAIIGVFALVTLIIAVPLLPAATGKLVADHATAGRRRAPRPQVWKDPRLVCVAVVVLCFSLVEGTAHDWLPLVMVDGHGFAEATSSLIYTAFTCAMALGRFVGSPFVVRFGRTKVLIISASSALLGLLLICFVSLPAAAIVGALLWGLGAALGAPLGFSAAGDADAHSTARVSFVATIGYIAFLAGPPILGLLGEYFTLREAMLVPALLAVLIIPLSPALRERKPRLETVEGP